MDSIVDSYVGKGDTHIGDGAWLGMRAMIMPGVRIGEGAIVAANSVVTRDVEPYSVVAGSPASVVKYRFNPDIIATLLALNIYDWPEEKFAALKPYLCASDIQPLVEAEARYEQKTRLGP